MGKDNIIPRGRIKKVMDGGTVTLLPGHYHDIVCCDCGLAHRFLLVSKQKSAVEIQRHRAPRVTGAVRAQKSRKDKNWRSKI